jgi:hypothetical protein
MVGLLLLFAATAFADLPFVPDQDELNATSGYTLQITYDYKNFFNNVFNFETENDPTHGYVNYVNQSTAQSKGYIKADSSTGVYIGCDHTNTASGRGRDSIRLSSQMSFNSGLFIIDLTHMPTGCGTWPAYWTVGPNWPNSGEVDVIEGVNVNTADATTLHTSDGCDQSHEDPSQFTGKWGTGSQNNPADNCYINAPDQWSNQGCGIVPSQANTYGTGFNNVKGGVYAHLWDPAVGIKAWFWTRSAIPSDITNGNPNPAGWGKPYAMFSFGQYCNSNHFANHQIIFDLTFCGDWAGNNFGTDCPGKGSCNTYVQNNPSAFIEAYWNINYVKVWSLN